MKIECDLTLWCWRGVYAFGIFLICDVLYRWARISSKDKIVLVAGAGTGIAAELCDKLHGAGVHVLAGCLFDAEVEQYNTKWGGGQPSGGGVGGPSSFAFKLDITNQASVDGAVELTSEWCRRWNGGAIGTSGLHAIVNCAGIIDGVAVELTPQSVFERVLGVNYFGHVRMCKAFIPLLRQSSGRIVEFSSMAGILAAPNAAAYQSSKWAIEGFSDALRIEMADWKIKVAIIEPGVTKTPLLNSVLNQPRICFDRSPPAIQTLYGAQYIADLERMYRLGPRVASHPRGVVKSVEHALFSVHPRDRYRVGIDAHIYALIRWLPTFVSDPIVKNMLWSPIPVALR